MFKISVFQIFVKYLLLYDLRGVLTKKQTID